MAGSALFSPPLTANVEPDSTLGKGSEARGGRGQPVLGGVGSCPLAGQEGGQEFPNWKGLQKTGSAKPSIHR